MFDGTMGEIRMFAGNFAPASWLFCQGQLLSISQYDTLYSIIGTIYGGDGQTTFALPNLCARTAIGTGQGPGLTNRIQGEMVGTNQNILTVQQMPAHTHTVLCDDTTVGRALAVTPGNNYPAQNQDASGNYATTTDAQFNPAMISSAGGNQPVDNMQPYLGMNYIICIEGIYPQRN